MDRIDQLNPYLSYRDGQKEAVQDIINAVDDHKTIIQLDAGVGAGKSLILTVAARRILETVGLKKAIYTTPQKKLVEQLRQDDRLNIPCLVGKANYPCASYPPELGITADTCPLPRQQRKELCPSCPYEEARQRFKWAKLGAATLSKLLFDTTLDAPDILIIDESSGLEERLINQSEITLPYSVHANTIQEDLQAWGEELRESITRAESKQTAFGEEIAGGSPGNELLAEAAKSGKRLRGLELQLHKVEYLLRILADGQKYVINEERVFRTLDGKRQFNRLTHDPQVVLMASGTPCPQMVCNDYRTVYMANPIPVEKRLVYFEPIGKMSAAEREKTIDKMAPKIAALHKEHGHNTLVHCHSYPCSEMLSSALMDEGVRVDYMERDKNDRKEEIIKSWMKGDGTILTSVGCEEGLDLKGPKFPLNVVAVVPFLFRGDKWVLKREESDKKLPYHQQHGVMSTAIAIQQATGRTTRGPDDFSKTYILDSNFAWFVRRYRQAFKNDFLRSVMVAAPAVA
jgi:Rad3-related DNA helicase